MGGKLKAVPVLGELGLRLTQCGLGRVSLHAMFHFDHATAGQQYTEVTDRTGRTGQRSDSIGRTIFGRPFVKRFALCYQTVFCLSVLSVCLSVTLVYCGQMVGWIKMKLDMQVGLGPGHIVLDGDPAELPSTKRGRRPPVFCAYLLWPNGWMDQDAT